MRALPRLQPRHPPFEHLDVHSFVPRLWQTCEKSRYRLVTHVVVGSKVATELVSLV